MLAAGPRNHRTRAIARFIRFVALLGAIVFTVNACRNAPPEASGYVGKIEAARQTKDANFRTTNDPVPADKKDIFLPLAYFAVDPDYNVPGVLRPSTDSPTMMMPTSTGQQRQMRRVGNLEFTLKGQPMKLTAFVEVGAPDLNRLFVPFTDMTSGTETYPAGRYMDLDRTPTGVYEMDFNLAYHPFCYFNESYDCPFPPAENRLKVPIRAGEKLKK